MKLLTEVVIVYLCLTPLSSCFRGADQATLQSLKCKPKPGTSGWPSEPTWNSFNASISGQLLKPLPPGAVCDLTLGVFNPVSCWIAAANFSQSLFHTNDPVSVQQPNWEHDACLPTIFHLCNIKQYPVYVVNATEAHHVQEGVKFAKKHNIRLNVKGTGHDYLGRYEGALTIAAGHQMREIYAKAAQNGRIIVGGMDPNVGIGGYITGGGHSPISGHYGLAADQVLEMEMVTPDGDFITANEAINTDLFWAMRGGGGATFGVLLSVTLKTFPMPSMGFSILNVNQSSAPTSDFWSAVARIHSELPDLAKSGLMGYYLISPYQGPMLNKPALSFWWLAGILNTSEASIGTTLKPLVNGLRNTPGLLVSLHTFDAPDFYDWWSTNVPPGRAGTNVLLGSRLLDAASMSLNVSFIAKKLEESFNGFALLGHLVGGPGVANALSPGGVGSMTPAWRKTITHLVVPVIWPPYDDKAEAAASSKLTNQYVASLRDLAPDTGCYLNEADVNEPHFTEAFWGQNYAKLLEIKRKYDPDGVFYCKNCVGAEDMVITEDQTLCHK